MSWNLTSKKFSTPMEYRVWKLLSCIFTFEVRFQLIMLCLPNIFIWFVTDWVSSVSSVAKTFISSRSSLTLIFVSPISCSENEKCFRYFAVKRKRKTFNASFRTICFSEMPTLVSRISVHVRLIKFWPNFHPVHTLLFGPVCLFIFGIWNFLSNIQA